MRTDLNELRNFLVTEYSKKVSFNKQYSKKAFARNLGISSTALNEFLSGRRDLSFKNVNTIFKYLNSQIHCSWCDKEKKKTKYLIAGPRSQYICDTCVEKCNEIVKNKAESPTTKKIG